MFWLLLCGGGTGFSVQRHHVDRLPSIRKPDGPEKVFVIPDTIEGWADALGVLLSTYFMDDQPFFEWFGYRVVFDGSQVRKKGSPLSSGSKAPGPGPLLRALELVRAKLDQAFEEGKYLDLGSVPQYVARLRPLHVCDIVLYAADAVRAGGVRRSATIALFSHDDEEMAKSKTGNWYAENQQRERANISAVLVRGEVTFEEFWRLFQWTKEFGEPGFVWVEHRDQGMNPCVEACLWSFLKIFGDDAAPNVLGSILPGSWSGVFRDEDGEPQVTGWQACNLSTINMALVKTLKDFLTAARAAAVLGTMQAGYTDLGYLGRVSELITEKEALLGVSMTAMCDSPDIAFSPEALEAAAAEVLRVNAEVASMLGINPSARSTLVKPEGTGTLTLDTFATGIHPWKHRKGIRHVGAGDEETPFKHFKKTNPHAVHARGSDYVVAFPYEAPPGAMIQQDVDALEMLRRVQLVQRHWVAPGRRPERCVKPFLMHNVSNTIDVAEDEWENVAKYIYENRQDFVGVAMMPAGGDKKYVLAPYTEVRTYEELEAVHGPSVVEKAKLIVANIGIGPQTWTDLEAFPYSDLLKDVELIERWEMLRALTVPVPWEQMVETDDDVDFGQDAACAGGACEIDWEALRAEAQSK
jgi:ribonucleoside-diphosphate reductase alpha chain